MQRRRFVIAAAAAGVAPGAVDDWLYWLRRRFAGAPARDAAKRSAVSATLVHLANTSYRLGRTIDFDPQTLRCADAEAQSMFTKQYRAPFHLPALA